VTRLLLGIVMSPLVAMVILADQLSFIVGEYNTTFSPPLTPRRPGGTLTGPGEAGATRPCCALPGS